MKATTIRMEDAVLERVDSLAKALNRSRTWVVNQAVQRFLGYEEWFIHEVKSGIREAENGDLASDKEVAERQLFPTQNTLTSCNG
ncbi:CopG family ribbon-helix-helix protein [Candidatus Electrothrix sp.]|uniref:CopG family ribbon-helix-helix protein n=1 Tax=Candidatus Electrothrix sp. TaxID=2170559 RepID=UPI004057723A